MDSDYDPRSRRLNPYIGELVATLDESWAFMLSSDDYLERKGRLRVLRQIIDQILEQPEWLEADLQPGAVDAEGCWFDARDFANEPAPVFLEERPFDTPGRDGGRHFFYTDTGRMSPLYEGEPIDPRLRPLMLNGLWVHTLESHYATAVETVNHVLTADLWKHCVPEHAGAGQEDERRYFLLCDPRGIAGGERTVHVASYADAERAVEVAEALSEELGIRFLVARERRRWCTR